MISYNCHSIEFLKKKYLVAAQQISKLWLHTADLCLKGYTSQWHTQMAHWKIIVYKYLLFSFLQKCYAFTSYGAVCGCKSPLSMF